MKTKDIKELRKGSKLPLPPKGIAHADALTKQYCADESFTQLCKRVPTLDLEYCEPGSKRYEDLKLLRYYYRCQTGRNAYPEHHTDIKETINRKHEMDFRMNKTVNNFDEFLKARGFGEKDEADVQKSTFKYTDCGASFYKEDCGVVVRSIVEGCDESTETHKLAYPFKIKEFWDALDKVEKEADEIWWATHGCEKCWDEPPIDEVGNELEFGAWPINPKCNICEGEGTII